VEFRLLYEGELPSSANKNKHPKEKHLIRKQFHPQLRRLWTVQSGLRQLAEYKGNPGSESGKIVEQSRFDRGIAVIGRNYHKGGFDLVPLVSKDYTLRCALDILLLRPGENKYTFQQGDIDGQLKTLFDALRCPETVEEAGGYTPTDDEQPLFCLLQDDRLISEIHITTDQLLLLRDTRGTKAIDAFAVIHVRLNHLGGSPFDRWFD